jgi:hypothetical protein
VGVLFIILIVPLRLFDFISRVSMVKKIVCTIRHHGISSQMMGQLRLLFEMTVESDNRLKSTDILTSKFIVYFFTRKATIKNHWGNKFFAGLILTNTCHIILLTVIEILLLKFLQISTGGINLVFAETKVFPRLVICLVSEENIGQSNKVTYNCAIPSNVVVERLFYTVALWLLISIIWNVICLFSMLYKARKTSRQFAWKLYSVTSANSISTDQEHDEFITYMSLNGHLVLLIFQGNLEADDFATFYAAMFDEFKTKVFRSVIDNNELQTLT